MSIQNNEPTAGTSAPNCPETPKTHIPSTSFPLTQSPNDNCTICFEPWTSGSEHRIVSLNCGHLYGKSCIEKWIKANGTRAKCPQCNQPAKLRDIRCVFAKTITAIDTSELEMTKIELEKERKLRMQVELDLANYRMKYRTATSECERLKQELHVLQESSKRMRLNSVEQSIHQISKKTKSSECFEFVKDIEISSNGGCRLISYSSLLKQIVVTLPISHPLFKGFGVRKISSVDFKANECINIHKKLIKDLTIDPYTGTIMSCSLDKTVKLTSLITRQNIQTFDLDFEPWSITYSPTNSNEIFVGLKNGSLMLLDTRKFTEPVGQINSLTNSPVVSLSYIQDDSRKPCFRGILAAQLDRCSFYERKDGIFHFKVDPVPIEGRFTSTHYDPKSGYSLVSCRPSNIHKRVTHVVSTYLINQIQYNIKCDLHFQVTNFVYDDDNDIIVTDVANLFEGGTSQVQLSKSRIFAHPLHEKSSLICAGDESSKGVLIWDSNSGNCVQKLVSENPILDLSLTNELDSNYFLTALTEKAVKVYRYTS